MSTRNTFTRIAMIGMLSAGFTVLTGCTGKDHQKNVNVAEGRWLTARSGLMLGTAQDYFDTGDLKQAESHVAEALSVDPRNPALHTLAGRIELEHDKLERAYHRFQTAIDLFDEEAPEGLRAPQKMPEPYYYQGIVLQRWQRFDKALERYEQALALKGDQIEYLLAVAEMHVAMDNRQLALDLLTSKLVYFGQNSGIRVTLAQLYAMNKNYPEAIAFYSEAVLLEPADLQIRRELASLQMATKDYEGAIENFERLAEAEELADNLDMKKALANCYLGIGRKEDAKQLYIKMARVHPRDPDIWTKLGEIAWSEKDLSGTLTAANRVMSTAPHRHEGYLMAGMVWHKRGRVDQAVRMFERAAQAAPDNALPQILRGMVLEQAGRRDEAAAAYTDALRRKPEDARAKRLLAAVEQAGQ